MAGMRLEYDEEGGTFFYFLLSFWGLVLIPATYYLWPRKKPYDETDKKKKICNCEMCQIKRQRLKSGEPWVNAKEKAIKLGIIIGWIIFIALAYKVSKIQLDYVEYDPFIELEIDRGASAKEIRKAYRSLSRLYHPDKETGDAKKFMRIAKAYAALTDEESRKNWEEHGNPDGPGVTTFGIALPKWIVEQENSMLVLAAYGLLFMVILPISVGVWWYRSIQFSRDQVLLDTTKLYLYFFSKVPNMILKKVIMVLAASFEFDKSHNSEIMERPSDNEEVPQLMKQLPNLDEKNKERPLCYAYSVKARALLHAHTQRLQLPANTLELDCQYILKKCPYLLNEMVNNIAQLVAGAAARGTTNHMPRLETLENCMKLSQMIIQALDQKSSPLLQLPHITQEMLKHFVTKRRNIQRIRDLLMMKDEERRSLLRSLTDDEYQDIMNVCGTMPQTVVTVKSEVLDDEDSSITAGSIVTVTVNIQRRDMEVNTGQDGHDSAGRLTENESRSLEHDMDEKYSSVEKVTDSEPKKARTWEKQKKKIKGKTVKAKSKKTKSAYQWKATSATATATATAAAQPTNVQCNGTVLPTTKSKPEKDEDQLSESEAEVEEAEEETEEANLSEKENAIDNDNDDNDDDAWSKYQEESKKENMLETKARESHPVHCPYFPEDKQECWWLYVADRKNHMLISAPVNISSLKREEEIQLKFSAPVRPGNYTYSVILRSDSYLDFDQVHHIKLDVKEAKIIEDHPQWDISEEEDNREEESEDAETESDDDESDGDSDC
ncbi:hypothetical protein ScPMuIL_012809 [Solemya velum]